MIREKMLNQIREHAAASYPEEACGLIVQIGHAQRYVRCRNVHPEPTEHFELAPEDYAAAEDSGQILAVVHSHPDATSRPSILDRAQCDAMGVPWYILSWPEGDFRRVEPDVWPRPLIGRHYVYGLQDCYSIVQDWYLQERDIELGRPETADGWWEDGRQDVIVESYEGLGFRRCDELHVGAVIVMQVSAPVTNHCAVYLGGGQMIHHMPGRLSVQCPYGGYWQERTRAILEYVGE